MKWCENDSFHGSVDRSPEILKALQRPKVINTRITYQEQLGATAINATHHPVRHTMQASQKDMGTKPIKDEVLWVYRKT
jgi:hypothetical protein